ncbi:MAG: TolC family protein, partial [Bacteroidetes bacterium]|nr:TolC family protein [Bacteroidota bacterium]
MKSIALLLSIFIVTHTCNAQLVFSSLDEIWKYADQHNINIRIAKQDLTKSGYAKQQSYSSLLPQVNGNGAFTDNLSLQTTLIPAEMFGGQPGTYRSLQFGQKYVYSGNITAQVPLVNVQNWIAIRIAKQSEEMSRDSFASARKNVYQQIAVQYYSCLLMQEAARLSDQTAGIADSVLQLTNFKFNQGTLNQADVDKASMNFIRAQQSQIIAYYQAV